MPAKTKSLDSPTQVNDLGITTQDGQIWQRKSDGKFFFRIETPTGEKIDVPLGITFTAKLSLDEAQILDLFDTPIEIVPAPVAGQAIQVVSASVKLTFDGDTEYANNLILELINFNGVATISDEPQAETTGANPLLGSTETIHRLMAVNNSGFALDDTQLLEAVALFAKVQGGNPTNAGNGGSLEIFVQYVLVDVS